MKRLNLTIAIVFMTSIFVYSQETKQEIELPKLTLEQKWETAESNLLYFIACGITYAKSKGETAADFGTWAGFVACPFWKKNDSITPATLVEGISWNKQQFKDFQMEVLEVNKSMIKGRMRNFGNKYFVENDFGITEDEYIRFFDKKWVAIAQCIGLDYKQEVDGDWIYFTVSQKN